jgi:hypothetical protein
MAAKASVLVFEASDLESCTAMVRQFFRDNRSANTIRVALSTRDLILLGARVWRLVDGNIDAISPIIAGFIMTQPHGSVSISARTD